MKKVELIKEAIEKATRRESKLTDKALEVPALSSLNIRHLMNNLGAISTNYLEQGVHKGGLFCSTICGNNNLVLVTAIDNWESDQNNEDKAEDQFDKNSLEFISENTVQTTIKSNSFDVVVDTITNQYDLYLFDADHSEDSQCRALTYFLPALADVFIFCVDDCDWPEVTEGTLRGIKESGVEVLYEKKLVGNNHDNEGWWNGFWVFLLKKKA